MKHFGSHGVYTPFLLRVYDVWVLGVSNRLAWRCPSRRLVEWYNRHVGRRHLDIGVGTGYFLDRCRFPDGPPQRLTLVDRNPNSLTWAAERVERYQPETFEADVLQPLPPGSNRQRTL